MSVNIFGLYSDWCANLTPLALVFTECVKLATCAAPSCASDGDVYLLLCGGGKTALVGVLVGASTVFVTCSISVSMGSVHKSADRSLLPFKIMFPLYHTSHLVLVNRTLHPELHNTLIPINNAMDNFGTMCPTNTFGSPGIVMSHVCVDITFVPSGRLMVSGQMAGHRFLHGVPSMMKIEVDPVSAIACNAF